MIVLSLLGVLTELGKIKRSFAHTERKGKVRGRSRVEEEMQCKCWD